MTKGYLKQLTQIHKSIIITMYLCYMWFNLNNVNTFLSSHKRGVNEPLYALVPTFKLNLL